MIFAAATALSDREVFEWGLAGGILALVITEVLPAAVAMATTGTGPTITFWRLVGIVLVFAIFATAGGGAAILMGDVTLHKTALLYGMAWQAILGGAIKTGKAALP